MKWIWMALVVAACSTASDAQQYKRIDNEELKELMKKDDVQLIDVRTPEETSYGVIEGAKLMDFYNPNFVNNVKGLDKDKPVIVYCAVGGRSASASQKLKQLGFKEIYDLKGGIRGWQQGGNPLSK